MRRSGLTGGLFVLLLASQAIVACSDDPAEGGGGSGSVSAGTAGTVGTAGKSTGGGGAAAGGSDSKAGNGGTFVTAGSGGSTAGSEAGGTAGSGGSGGMATPPDCVVDEQCGDDNPCTDDKCTDGECAHTNNTASCNDDNQCTDNDKCADGECKGTNNTNPCNDLSTCTTNDKCTEGVCTGTNNAELCPVCAVPANIIQNCDFTDELNHWAAGIGFDGGSAVQTVVNERAIIDIDAGGNLVHMVQPRQEMLTIKQGMKYKLRIVAGASVDREMVIALTKNADPYTVYTNPADGGFKVPLTLEMKPHEFDFKMTQATDANVKLEIKMGGPIGNPSTVYFDDVVVAEVKCTDNPSCDDDNECTTDVCDVATGICANAPSTDECTDDGNSCTTDVCDAGACTHPVKADNVACTDDEDACTNDICLAGTCKNKFDVLKCPDCLKDSHCDDEDPCSTDTCNLGSGECEYADSTAACDDGNVCTSADVCAAGECNGTANTATCDDDDVCTVKDTCAASDCSAGTNKCVNCRIAGNLVTNCDFEDEPLLKGWADEIFFGGQGTQAVENGMLVVTITNGGTFGYMVQPRQPGLVFELNATYSVKFNAYASVPRSMAISMTQDGNPYSSYSGEKTFELTTEMQELGFTFKMESAPPDQKVKLELRLGGPGNAVVPNKVYLDNFIVTKVVP
jgi:hypothetical protein